MRDEGGFSPRGWEQSVKAAAARQLLDWREYAERCCMRAALGRRNACCISSQLKPAIASPSVTISCRMDPLQYEFPFDFTDMPSVEEREAATGLHWAPDGERVKFVTEEQAVQARVSALSVQFAIAPASMGLQ